MINAQGIWARRSYIMSTQFIFSLRKDLNPYAGVIEKEVVADGKSTTDVVIFYFLNNLI